MQNPRIPPFKIKPATRNLLPFAALVLFSVVFFLPYLREKYISDENELFLYRSYLRWFLATLKTGSLPLWNNMVGSGNPAVYFGHYPIHYSLLFYYLFGCNIKAYAWLRLVNLLLLQAVYMWSSKKFGYSYLSSAIGAWIYFAVNFITFFILEDTCSNAIVFTPALYLVILRMMKDGFRGKTALALYFILFFFWSSGTPVTFLFMPFSILLAMYFYAGRIYKISLKKIICHFPVLFILPWIMISPQLYLIVNGILASGRILPGAKPASYALDTCIYFARSLYSSSYIWLFFFYATYLLFKRRAHKPYFPCGIICFSALAISLAGLPVFQDLTGILTSMAWWASILLLLAWGWTSGKLGKLRLLVPQLIFVTLLLSYFFFLPGNIPDANGTGSDYALFHEMNFISQVFIVLLIYLATYSWHKRPAIKIYCVTLALHYFFRSHLSILLFQWANIVWYATRDGIVFSFLFSLLAMEGISPFLHGMRIAFRRSVMPIHRFSSIKRIAIILICFAIFLSAYGKVYFSKDRYAQAMDLSFPPSSAAKDGEIWQTRQVQELLALSNSLMNLNHSEKMPFRIFTPENMRYSLSGFMQDKGIFEAALYESCIPRILKAFYENTLLQKKRPPYDLRLSLLQPQHAKHVHLGFGIPREQIPYNGFYVYNAGDSDNPFFANIEFWLQLAGVKYLLVTKAFVNALKLFPDSSSYTLHSIYPTLNAYLLRWGNAKPWERFRFLPLRASEDAASAIARLNSEDIEVLRAVYAQTEPVANLQINDLNNHEIQITWSAPAPGILIQFETWNRDWHITSEKDSFQVSKAFQIFRSIPLASGEHSFRLKFAPVGFFEIFWISIMFTMLLPIGFFVAGYAEKRAGKKVHSHGK